MEIAVTEGIKICVKTKFETGLSSPCKCLYYFSYLIEIENNSSHEVQLLRRKWMIFDSIGDHLLVEGEGVVGKKPILAPKKSYTYSSYGNLTSSIGSMKGFFNMINFTTTKKFRVYIPSFQLTVPAILN